MSDSRKSALARAYEEIDRLKAENERLREALERIEYCSGNSWRHTQIHELAVDALAGSPAFSEEYR